MVQGAEYQIQSGLKDGQYGKTATYLNILQRISFVGGIVTDALTKRAQQQTGR